MVNWKFGASVVVSAYIASTVGLNYDPEPKCCYVVCDESGCSEGFLPSSEAIKITVGVFVMCCCRWLVPLVFSTCLMLRR